MLWEFFPHNAVEYFVSYYDYYQPEAYIPHTDTFIEKDSAINEEIDRLRLSATASLMERRDVIVVSSVSCIYGLGEPEDFAKMMVSLRVGATLDVYKRQIHGPHLGQGDVALVDEEDEVFGEVVQQGVGGRTHGPPLNDPGIVLDAGAVAKLLHHLHVVHGCLLYTSPAPG